MSKYRFYTIYDLPSQKSTGALLLYGVSRYRAYNLFLTENSNFQFELHLHPGYEKIAPMCSKSLKKKTLKRIIQRAGQGWDSFLMNVCDQIGRQYPREGICLRDEDAFWGDNEIPESGYNSIV